MPKNKKHIDLELIIGNTLRYGVWLSLFLSGLGIVLLLIKNPNNTIQFENLPNIPNKFSFIEMFKGIAQFDSLQITMFGVFILLITPLARVVFALFGYWLDGNKLYTVITAIVLIIVGISVWIGAKH